MTLPLAIVVARALATIPVCALLALGQPDADRAALALFVLAAASDAVDGRVARARGEVTALGAALDPLADKILVVGALSALALRGLVPLWALAIVVARELAAVGIRGATRTPLPATVDGKLKTTFQVGAGAMLMLAAVAHDAALASVARGVLAAALALTVVSGLRLIVRAVQTAADAR